MATTSERDVFEAVKLARSHEDYGGVAHAMAALELARQQRAANLIALATVLQSRATCTDHERTIASNMLHTAAEITGMRPDGTIIA